jgi:hypothetical protein
MMPTLIEAATGTKVGRVACFACLGNALRIACYQRAVVVPWCCKCLFFQLPHCDFNTSISRNTELCTEGFSLMPLLQGETRDWNHAAFSQYQRGTTTQGACVQHSSHACLAGDSIMGYTMRMDTLRYTEWVAFDFSTNQADFDKVNFQSLVLSRSLVLLYAVHCFVHIVHQTV